MAMCCIVNSVHSILYNAYNTCILILNMFSNLLNKTSKLFLLILFKKQFSLILCWQNCQLSSQYLEFWFVIFPYLKVL
jgi:hypothetical protein